MCCKVLEKIICKRIISIGLYNRLFSTTHGLLPGRSTTTYLLSCLDQWFRTIDQNDPVGIIYIDFQKAFDKVPHRRLLLKSSKMGIKRFCPIFHFMSKLLNPFPTPFLSNRAYHRVLFWVLSYLTLHMSDLGYLLKSDHSFFADDFKMANDPIEHDTTLTNDLNTLVDMCKIWLIPINRNKCSCTSGFQ